MRRSDPGCDRLPRLLGDLKLDRPLGLLLHDNRTGGDSTSMNHVVDAQPNQVAATQLAADGEVEQRELSCFFCQLQPNPDGPDLFQLQGRLLAEQLAFVPRRCTRPSVLTSVSMNGSSVEEKEPCFLSTGACRPVAACRSPDKRTFADFAE
jgi:hypothetical protein